MTIKKILIYIIVAGALFSIIFSAYIYFKAFTPNTSFEEKSVSIYIPSNSNSTALSEILSPYIKDVSSFLFVAEQRKYLSNIKAGKFTINKGNSNFEIVQQLRKNVPVKVAFNNQETIYDLAGRLATQIEPDSLQLVEAFLNPYFLEENQVNEETVLALFMPNTYEFYWNTDAKQVANKLAKNYRQFWTPERIAQAVEQNLTPMQVMVLASIVQKETAKADERPKVAGVYLNRLNIGMPLQADPTVIFAKKKLNNDFSMVIKRVLTADTQLNSPYNTYKNIGLPPGPIFMPDLSSVKAVLNPEKHNYLYFCASVTRFGYHDFAVNYNQHIINARAYVNWLNSVGIRK